MNDGWRGGLACLAFDIAGCSGHPNAIATTDRIEATSSAVAPSSGAQVAFDLADRDRLFAFPPSISRDGRLVALLVSPFDFDYDRYVEQRLVIAPVDGVAPVMELPLSSVYTDGSLEQLDRGESTNVEKVYRARAAKANERLAQHGFYPLTTECGVEVDVLDEKLTVRRTGETKPCHEASFDAWMPPLSEPRCAAVNRVLIDVAACAPARGLLVMAVGMNGGHVGCPPPPTAVHVLRVGPECLAGVGISGR